MSAISRIEGPAGRRRYAGRGTLDDVVLGRALSWDLSTPVSGGGDIEPEHPPRPHDRHGGVHVVQRDLIQQGLHVPEMRHRDADLGQPRRAKGRDRGHSRSVWAGRRRSRGRSGPLATAPVELLERRASEWSAWVRITQGRSRSGRRWSLMEPGFYLRVAVSRLRAGGTVPGLCDFVTQHLKQDRQGRTIQPLSVFRLYALP